MKKAHIIALFAVIALGIIVVVIVISPRQRVVGNDILVDVEWLASNIDNVQVVEYGRPYNDFQEGHIPGAVYLDRSLFYVKVNDVNGMLPDPDDIGSELGARGISNNRTIVLYDYNNSLWASRAFWGLEVLGHKDVRLLDGGLLAWQNSGKNVSTNETILPASNFRVRYQPNLVATLSEVSERHGTDDYIVLDARSSGEYNGTDIRTSRGGHIPEAIHINWNNNTNANGTFKSIPTLASIYGTTIGEDARIATHCQTGVRGAHSYFVLRLLGYKDVALYDGSWIEWGNLEHTPITLP